MDSSLTLIEFSAMTLIGGLLGLALGLALLIGIATSDSRKQAAGYLVPALVIASSAIAFFKDPPQTRSERIQIAMLYAFGVSFVTMLLFFPPVPSTAPKPPTPEPFTYAANEFRVGYDIIATQPLAYIKDSQGESPLPIDRIEEHPGPRELIVEGDWITLRLPQEKEQTYAPRRSYLLRFRPAASKRHHRQAAT